MKVLIKIFATLIFAGSVIAQQSGEGQSVELPEFVITGVRKINIPEVKKQKPPYIPMNIKKYISQSETPENLTPVEVSNPAFIVGPENKISEYNALLTGAVGTVTFPRGEFFYNNQYGGLFLNADIWGMSEREFVKDAGFNQTGAKLNLGYSFDHNEKTLGGLRLGLSGEYFVNSYNLYGSAVNLTRVTRNGNIGLSISNNFSSVRYGIGISGELIKFDENKLTQTLTTAGAFVKFPVGLLTFGLTGSVQNQSLVNNLSRKSSYDYFTIKPEVRLKIFNRMELIAGLFFSQRDNSGFFSPHVKVGTKITKRLSAFAEFAPRTEFLTVSDFINRNRFYKLNSIENVYMKRNNNIKFSLAYGYLQYFEIDADLEFNRYDNLPYFERPDTSGNFILAELDGVNDFAFNTNAFFDFFKYGKLSAGLKYQIITKGGNQIPYYPLLTSEFTYWYGFNDRLDATLRLNYSAKIYADLQNTKTVPDYLTFGFSVGYELFENFKITFDAENLFNRKNYLFENYRAKTLDVIAGFEYRW